ncbi:MAG: N-acetylmuramoyl-L-alanine amidase [Oscillospiraceae bacterium]|jgi:N-acetylmuramoyl-L-alanine amidase|nr:N-acetylmuramoyl-L-alanine amidase [Oscillospiraceae bacterium]
MPKIAIYAGHGGSDYGAVSGALREKDFNLAISNATSDILRRLGYDVLNNRTTDVDRNITRDVEMANNQGADALVEIHMNSNEGTPGTGSEAFYSIKDTGKGQALAEAILAGMERLGFVNRGARVHINANGQDTFGILRLTNMPAVLFEAAFINNPQDMQKLNIQSVADVIGGAVARLFPTTAPPVPPNPEWSARIRNIQSTLNSRYGFNLTVDGAPGPLTRSALVKGFQTELNRQFGRNITIDGIFGPETRAATVNVRPGARGNMTFLIQAALFIRGFTDVNPDGVFGPITENAVRQFQRAAGLNVDSIVGPNTQNALFNW